MQDEACDPIEPIAVSDWIEQGDPPVDPEEARVIANDVHEMVTFVRQVAEREMASFEKNSMLEDNYALLVQKTGETLPIKLQNEYGEGSAALDGVHAMLASVANKCKIILLRRNCYYIPKEETFNYVNAGFPGYKNFKGAKRQIILDVESSNGSIQMLLKLEEKEGAIVPCPPELGCMHASSRNKWFNPPKPVTTLRRTHGCMTDKNGWMQIVTMLEVVDKESTTAWFSDC